VNIATGNPMRYIQLETRGTTRFRTPAPEPKVKEGRNYYYCIIVIFAKMYKEKMGLRVSSSFDTL